MYVEFQALSDPEKKERRVMIIGCNKSVAQRSGMAGLRDHPGLLHFSEGRLK